MSVTVPVADDSNAPMSHGPVAGRGVPAASKQAAGTVPQTSNVRFVPVCQPDELLLVSWYGGELDAFSIGSDSVLCVSCVVGSPSEFPQACQVAITEVSQPPSVLPITCVLK